MPKILTYLLVFSISLAIAGCGGRKTKEDIDVDSIDATNGGVSTMGLDDGVGGTVEGLGDSFSDDDPLGKRVIYFEYDSSVLTAEAEQIVAAHAQYLGQAQGIQLILEGHADERGTREYNLALAEDRAKVVANTMQALGVQSVRIQTVSYGEERPVALGHDDGAWNLNRRVEILYQ